jgi:hypothetical protein
MSDKLNGVPAPGDYALAAGVWVNYRSRFDKREWYLRLLEQEGICLPPRAAESADILYRSLLWTRSQQLRNVAQYRDPIHARFRLYHELWVLQAEWQYHDTRRPFVKVYPPAVADLIELGRRTALGELKLPYAALAVTLPASSDAGVLTCAGRVANSNPHGGALHLSGEVRSILVSRIGDAVLPADYVLPIDRVSEPAVFAPRLVVSIELGSGDYIWHTFRLDSALDLDIDPLPSPSQLDATHLAIGTALVMTSHPDCVEREVVKRNRAAYESSADAAERDALVRDAEQKAVVGHRIVTLRGIVKYTGDAASGRTRGELSYQHARRGHYRNVRYGSGRAKQRLVFVRDTVVRPDKPRRPGDRQHGRGYALDDESLRHST